MSEKDLLQLDKDLIAYIAEGKTWSDLSSQFREHPINVIATRLRMLEESEQIKVSVVYSAPEIQK
jgi:hypothetical protein